MTPTTKQKPQTALQPIEVFCSRQKYADHPLEFSPPPPPAPVFNIYTFRNVIPMTADSSAAPTKHATILPHTLMNFSSTSCNGSRTSAVANCRCQCQWERQRSVRAHRVKRFANVDSTTILLLLLIFIITSCIIVHTHCRCFLLLFDGHLNFDLNLNLNPTPSSPPFPPLCVNHSFEPWKASRLRACLCLCE